VASNPRIDDLRKRLEKEPGSRLFAQLAEELRKDGEFEEAIRIARAGLARHSSYPSARMTLGRALFDTGDMAAAREELQTVLNGAPDNILASRLLAECLEALGDLPGALARYRATLALSPGDKQISARIRDLDGKLQAGPVTSAGVAAPIPVTAVDEPMELETSHERPPPAPSPTPIPLVETSAEFELETAYDAPGTQWRSDRTPEAAPTAAPTVAISAPIADDSTIGERTLIDEPVPTIEPAPTIDIRPPAAASPPPEPPPAAAAPVAVEPEPSFDYAFDMPEAAPAAPPPPQLPPAPPPAPQAPTPPAVEAMPSLPPPVAVAAPAAPVEPPARERPQPATAPEPFVEPEAAVRTPPPPSAPLPPPPPPPVVAAPAPVPATAGSEGGLASSTLAELYFNQGFPEKAIEVYRRLLDLEPGNDRARARLAELHEMIAPPAPPPVAVTAAPAASGEAEKERAARRQALERTIERLESLRAALQKGSR
jgi:tetratricopeptide (TPR) repeat protein